MTEHPAVMRASIASATILRRNTRKSLSLSKYGRENIGLLCHFDVRGGFSLGVGDITGRMRAVLRRALFCVAVMAWLSTDSVDAEAARIGLSVGGGAGAPGVHLEHHTTSRTALSLTGGLNRLYSGYYLQAGAKFFWQTGGVGPYAHLTATYGSGRTGQAVWQTGELGLALGNSWRLAQSVYMNLELGYAVGDGASYAPSGYGSQLSFSSTGRYTIGWRLLFGG